MIAVVTGGCRGLGYSFTKYLNSIGYEVYALYNNSIDMALELESTFDNVRAVKCDIRNEANVSDVFFNIDKIDLLINNAAIAKDNTYLDKTKKEFMSVLETNVVGTFLVIKYALSKMKREGVILNISSNNALGANSVLAMDYDVSKAGVNMLTLDFKEVVESDYPTLRVVSICPGWINTDSVKEMNQEYLALELKKSEQKEILDPDLLVKKIIDDMGTYKNGDIIEIRDI